MIEIILLLLFAIVIIFIAIYIIAVAYFNDLDLPNVDLSKFKNVLIIYPHPDDEVLTCVGLVGKLNELGAQTTLLCLTKGEKGTPDAHLNPELKDIRSNELVEATKILKYSNVIHLDMGDGELEKKVKEITDAIQNHHNQIKPDLIVTYDLAGFYGHPDHIVCAQAITELFMANKINAELWYSSMSANLLKQITLPEHMAHDPKYKDARKFPTHKLFIFKYMKRRLDALYKHKSQIAGFEKILAKHLPIWLVQLPLVYEYFYVVKRNSV